MKLSIVVPVYGVEKYISQCISSLLEANNDYEILVVNDGTKDNSINIIKEKYKDSRIRIIEQDNAGLSAARNFGIREARGEYIWCFDSDDWAEPGAISQLLKEINGEEMLYFRAHYRNYDEDGHQVLFDMKNEAKTGVDLASHFYWLPAQFYIFQKKFLMGNKLFFKEGILHEDALFTPNMILQCKTVKCLTKPLYHYRQRSGSIMNAPVNPKRLHDLIYVIAQLLEIAESIDDDIKYKWGSCIAQLTNELLFCSKKCDDRKSTIKVKEFVNDSSGLLNYLSHSSLKNRIMARLAQLLSGNLYLSYSILYKFRY